MNILKGLCAMAFALSLTACDSRQSSSRVEAIYNSMTQEERIAQLRGAYLKEFFDDNNRLDTAKCRQLLANGIGHFSQYATSTRKSPDELRDMVAQMQAWLRDNTPSGIPALFHEEVLSGISSYGSTVYPQQIGLACSFNPALAAEKTHQTAVSLRKIGGFLALSPMVDVVRTPSFNRLEESYGEDAYLSAAMGVAFVKGLQHGNLHEGVAACTKHFLGYGGGGDAAEKELMEDILLPHEAIIRTAGSRVVMTGYHAFHGVKCVANTELQQSILRDYLHFDGLLVSDYGSIEQVADSLTPVQRAAAAINAGNDVDFPEGVSYAHLQEAIDQGLVSQEVFAAAVKRVLRLKEELGMFDAHVPLYAEGPIQFDSPEERQTAYRLATQSVVLLQNDGTLPLRSDRPLRIALTGPNANSMWAMLGDYSYHAMRYFWQSQIEDDEHPHIVKLREGMQNRLPAGFTLNYSRGCDWTETVETVVDRGGDPRAAYMFSIQNRMIDSGETADPDEALKIARESDVIVAAVGENAMLCGENRDRTSLRLPGRQEDFVNRLIATGKPVVLVIFGGRAQVIEGLASRCAAVIQAWYPGEEGGNALADILYGNVSPSGKLSVTYPAVELHEPICYNTGLTTDDPHIAYPFGHGLTYTTFEYSNLHAPATADITADNIPISLTVKNTGSFPADEIVQLYISPKDASAALRPIALQGFTRVTLAPGESKEVTFSLSPQQFGYYAAGQWHIAPATYTLCLAASSADIRLQSDITLTGSPQTLPLRTRYFSN